MIRSRFAHTSPSAAHDGILVGTAADHTLGLTPTQNYAPQLEAATYRFTPSTGAVCVIEDSIAQPNGVAVTAAVEGHPRTVYHL